MKIKKETATRHEYTIRSTMDEEVEIISFPYLHRVYDEQGNLLQEMTYNRAGEIQEHLAYRYDDQNRRIEVINYYDEEEVMENICYFYEDGENPCSAVRKYADGSEESIAYRYDEGNNLIEKKVLSDESEEEEIEQWQFEQGKEILYEKFELGELVFRQEQAYDDQGKIVEVTLTEAPDNLTTLHRFFYNDKGQRTRIEKYNAENKLISVIEILSFHEGEPTEITETTAGGKTIIRYGYDDQRRVVLQQEYSQEGLLVNEWVRSYNDQGFLQTTEVTTDRLGAGMNQHYRIEYAYEYY